MKENVTGPTEQRLIDANAEVATIKENVCKNCNSYGGIRCRSCWVDDAIGFLDDAPSVDAVEVVRCKECEHCEKDLYCRCHRWMGHPQIVKEDDFCSYGERRTT